MTKNNKWIGIALLGGALALMVWQSNDQAQRMKAYQAAQAKKQVEVQQAKAELAAKATPVALSPAPVATPAAPTFSATPVLAPKPVATLPAESLVTLENSLIKVTFTSRGGAIRSVALKEYPLTQKSKEPYVLRAPEALPFMALGSGTTPDTLDLANYTLAASTANTVTYTRTIAPGLSLERHYTLSTPNAKGKRTADGYTLEHQLTWRNTTAQALQLPRYFVNVGVAQPTLGDPTHVFLNFGQYNGREAHFVGLPHFKGGGFLFWTSPAQEKYAQSTPTTWAAVKNQFFTMVATPEAPAAGYHSSITLAQNIYDTKKTDESLAGFLEFDAPTIPAAGSLIAKMSNYIGPKEYARLSSLGQGQDEIMQWGWPIFSFFSKLFISMLNGIAHAVHNYGVAIIALTLIIRAAMWPFTAAAAEASKKMAAVQPILKEVQTKYKDNPEKLQRETLRIFQENKVNPLAGCLPALMQIPVFIGFFYMLRSAAELRFESFLWMSDLSMPDTVAMVGGFPINPLPVIMLITMYYQIKLTPSAGDPQTQKIMQFSPFLFSFLLYNFSAGLTLYWTLSNVVSIIQQIIVNRSSTPPTNSQGGNVIDIKAETVKR